MTCPPIAQFLARRLNDAKAQLFRWLKSLNKQHNRSPLCGLSIVAHKNAHLLCRTMERGEKNIVKWNVNQFDSVPLYSLDNVLIYMNANREKKRIIFVITTLFWSQVSNYHGILKGRR